MRKRAVLCAMIVSCMLCVACGDKEKENNAQKGVNEIVFATEATKKPSLEPDSTKGASDKNDSKDADHTDTKDEKDSKKSSYEKITSKAKIKTFGGTIQIGEAGYELYSYVESLGKRYTTVVNRTANALKGKAKVYDIIVPTSVGITLPDNKIAKVNSSNQNKAIKGMYKNLNKNVTGIPLYDTFMQHRTEYIYFRTDHHWTSRGAYYAYQQFCEVKGIEPRELSDYKTKNFGGFYGSFYTDTNKSRILKKDKVKAYYPVNNKKISMIYHHENGGKYKAPVICDGTNYSTQLKYCAFLAGDNPYTVVRNKKVKDGSSCLVVKESYGNAFVPYLADDYQKVYVVDYRYWKGSIKNFVKKNKVQDVIFINNISMTRNAYLIGKLAQIQ